ncbi:BSD domain-containing protein 1 isoform X1 [Pleurodeles waltl]|uniref:BSD domain-containing protein 1 isoform X1 n=1 Tax=Pleurodeles waltl TaxID=8319 RepID=UPI0037095334
MLDTLRAKENCELLGSGCRSRSRRWCWTLSPIHEDGGWWRSWLQQSYQNVRDKSVEALEFIKKDLTEFSQVVQHDTACTIAATANVVKEKLAVENSAGPTEKVKKGLSDFLGAISDTFAPSPDKTIDCDVITLMATPSGSTELYDSTKARLYSMQSDPATYCNEPDGPPELFEFWLSQWSLEDMKGEISDLLVNSPSIRALYTKMVPAAVSHSEFWQRYFYKVHTLEQDEARRCALKQRAEQSAHEEHSRWEEDEEDLVGIAHPSHLDLTCPGKEERSAPAAEAPLLPAYSTARPEEHKLEHADPTASIASPSESTESTISPITQIANPAHSAVPAPTGTQPVPEVDQSQQLLGVSSEELASRGLEAGLPTCEPLQTAVQLSAQEQPEAKTGNAKATTKEGDLRVFELNSDSGKSTPSNNGKKGSSTDVSEDWEKDFDLDMTEEEVQLALSKVDVSKELEEEEWEDWQ